MSFLTIGWSVRPCQPGVRFGSRNHDCFGHCQVVNQRRIQLKQLLGMTAKTHPCLLTTPMWVRQLCLTIHPLHGVYFCGCNLSCFGCTCYWLITISIVWDSYWFWPRKRTHAKGTTLQSNGRNLFTFCYGILTNENFVGFLDRCSWLWLVNA